MPLKNLSNTLSELNFTSPLMDEELSKSLLKDAKTTALLLEEIANSASVCAGVLRILGQKRPHEQSDFFDHLFGLKDFDHLFGLEDAAPRKRQRKD